MNAPAPNFKQKPKVSVAAGVYKPDVIKDVAESLGITNLPEVIAQMLASDVEYRIQQVIEEAARFTRHSRRGTMTTADIDEALKVLNIEPLYGHSSQNPPAFRRAPGMNPVYFVEDEEIDFERVIREEKVFLPKPVSYTAHWLAVEGVQPLVPENPPALPKEIPEDVKPAVGAAAPGAPGLPPTPPSETRPQGAAALATNPNVKPAINAASKQPLVKQVLSRELQLYYARLTASLLPPSTDNTKRTAALASLRHDAGLQPLLPYLVRWVGEGVVGTLKNESPSETDGQVLDVLIEVLSALMSNPSLFVEPYLHQILPSLLSTLLTSSLPSANATRLRTLASQTIGRILSSYSTTYPSLSPRIMKTLLVALLSPTQSKAAGTREGAVRGLVGIGTEAVRKGLLEGGAIKTLGMECMNDGLGTVRLSEAVIQALELVAPPSQRPEVLDVLGNEEDIKIADKLRDACGDLFGQLFLMDRERARKFVEDVLGPIQAEEASH